LIRHERAERRDDDCQLVCEDRRKLVDEGLAEASRSDDAAVAFVVENAADDLPLLLFEGFESEVLFEDLEEGIVGLSVKN
jgi:hypothetical protein